MALRGTARELTAIAEGGAQRTVWPANDGPMLLTGPAEIICRGEALLDSPSATEREAETF
jgi:diaminopimelate epimerase